MEFGRRILPQVVDYYAQTYPSRVYASIPESATDLSHGFRDVTMAKLAAVVNHLSWWLEGILGVGNLDAIAYIGPADIRNQVVQNEGMIVRTGCRALFYAEEMAPVAEALRGSQLPGVVIRSVPSLDELLLAPEDTKLYPYERTFDEARDEPCLILHSSGSTGDPKLVTMTHGTFACTDNDRNVPVPEGRIAQNAAQFDFQGGGRFYSCFPPYHLAGVHAYIDLPIFSNSATVVFGPTKLPPSGYLLSEILKHQKVRAFYVPPSIIEQWAAEPGAAEQSTDLDFILYGGGPLSPNIGQELSKTTNVCQMYGSLEVGQVQILVPQPGEWSWLELNPFEEADMQPVGDGTFEMVLHQNPKLTAHRSVWHNFPDVKEWRTGDLFVPHPSKPGLWRFHGRVDDLIVFSSSYKLRPIEMETLIQGNPLLNGALIVGQGKPEPLLIVEPKPGAVGDGSSPESLIDRIWPTVEEANKIAPSYATISRSRVLVADSARPFVRAPKGTVVRKLTAKAYAAEIDAAYLNKNPEIGDSGKVAAVENVSDFILPGVKQFVRKHVEEHFPNLLLSDTDNIFLSGLDSLGTAALSRSLEKALPPQAYPAGSNTDTMFLRLVYANPTIEKLASVIFDIITNRKVPDHSIGSDAKEMDHAVKELTEALPSQNTAAHDAIPSASSEKVNIALIGPRGSLGPSIVRDLLADPRVAKIYCLNRGNEGKELLRSITKDRKLSFDVEDERLSFFPIELGKPQIGLSSSHLDEILSNVNVIIHNAWHVDFSWTLDSYKETYLHSVRELVNISSLSPLRPRIAFVSSVASVQNWAAVFPDQPVDEAPLESYEISSPLGYGQSKHIAERVLARASDVSGTPVTILRLGQIAGPTDPDNGGGTWATDEWVPSLAALSKTLRLIPSDLPPIDWVPLDLASRAIVELALVGGDMDEMSDDQRLLRVFNVVNPNLTEWSVFVAALQRRLDKGEGRYQQLSFAEWVDALVRTDPGTLSEAEASLSTRILPYFQHLAETAARGVVLQPKFKTTESARSSRTIRELKRIDEKLIDGWLQQWEL
ncbi:putative NRPS-like protein biosynthetic cluster [Cytospora paraplurivora]|uniref:NRPS-like protein biosynthetic cluster n=1 Tax=Cytospora paraplurivora TaxID=2898453 RepID=A0AAN9UAA7_9PEZI